MSSRSNVFGEDGKETQVHFPFLFSYFLFLFSPVYFFFFSSFFRLSLPSAHSDPLKMKKENDTVILGKVVVKKNRGGLFPASGTSRGGDPSNKQVFPRSIQTFNLFFHIFVNGIEKESSRKILILLYIYV